MLGFLRSSSLNLLRGWPTRLVHNFLRFQRVLIRRSRLQGLAHPPSLLQCPSLRPHFRQAGTALMSNLTSSSGEAIVQIELLDTAGPYLACVFIGFVVLPSPPHSRFRSFIDKQTATVAAVS